MMDFETWIAIILFVVMVSLPGWAALYTARHREAPTTYASMEATIRALSEQVRGMHVEIARLQSRVTDLTLGVGVLSSQLRELGHVPEYAPSAEPDAPEPTTDATALYNRLIREFDLNELSDLAFRMGIETGELGEETKSGRARALIRYAERRGELLKLASTMNSVRPKRARR